MRNFNTNLLLFISLIVINVILADTQLYCQNDKTIDKSKVLKKTVKDKLALAKEFENKNTIEDRRKAERLYREALKLSPFNVDIMYSLAELKRKQGFYWNYENILNEILEYDSTNSKSIFKLARMRIDKIYKYKYLHIRNTPISFEKFKEKEIEEAQKLLQKALNFASNNSELYYLYGLTFVVDKKWNKMKYFFAKAIERDKKIKTLTYFLD